MSTTTTDADPTTLYDRYIDAVAADVGGPEHGRIKGILYDDNGDMSINEALGTLRCAHHGPEPSQMQHYADDDASKSDLLRAAALAAMHLDVVSRV